jgi:hypothetical protein
LPGGTKIEIAYSRYVEIRELMETAIKTLQEIAASIPETVPGMERQMLIGDLISRGR